MNEWAKIKCLTWLRIAKTVSRDLNVINEFRYWRVVVRSASISSRLDEYICKAPIYLGVATHKRRRKEKNGGWRVIKLELLA